MFELKLGTLTVRLDFSFFAAVTLLMLLGGSGYALWGLAACLWHEMGHFIVMITCGVRVRELIFYGAGIKIVPDKRIDFTGFGASLMIFLAGSFANFLAAAAMSLSDKPEIRLFGAVNAVIGAFNLLPLGYLDGGKIILLVIRSVCDYPHACLLERYLKWLNVILILVALIAFAFVKLGNFTLYLTLCYLLVSAISC